MPDANTTIVRPGDLTMRIGELAQRFRHHTVRFYERAGWLPSAPRQDNGYRDHREEDVEHLRLLIDLRRIDLPLEDGVAARLVVLPGHCDQDDGRPADAARREAARDRRSYR